MIGFQRQWRAGLMDYDIFQQGGVKAQYSLHPLRGAQSHPFGAGSQFPTFQSTLRSSTATEDGLRSEAELSSIYEYSTPRLVKNSGKKGILSISIPKKALQNFWRGYIVIEFQFDWGLTGVLTDPSVYSA